MSPRDAPTLRRTAVTPSRTLALLLPLSILLLAPLLGGCGRVTLDLGAGGRTVFIPIDRLPPGVDARYDPSPDADRFEIHTRAQWIFWAVPLNHPDWERETRGLLSESGGIEFDWTPRLHRGKGSRSRGPGQCPRRTETRPTFRLGEPP
jgi:hypothetical protein